MSPNGDQPLDDAKRRFISPFRRSNDYNLAPTSAQVSSSVSMRIHNGTLQANHQSTRRRVTTPLASALPRLCARLMLFVDVDYVHN